MLIVPQVGWFMWFLSSQKNTYIHIFRVIRFPHSVFSDGPFILRFNGRKRCSMARTLQPSSEIPDKVIVASIIWGKRGSHKPIVFMYWIFTYTFTIKNQPNVGKYTIHVSYGKGPVCRGGGFNLTFLKHMVVKLRIISTRSGNLKTWNHHPNDVVILWEM